MAQFVGDYLEDEVGHSAAEALRAVLLRQMNTIPLFLTHWRSVREL